jgi:roadblock/LC7 domain-containing protein
MYCDEALDAVEAVAAGEVTPDGRLADHYATCPNCAAALDDARMLDRMLQNRPVPKPSAQFTTRAMTRVRRARWRSDQVLDIGFNVAVAGVVMAIVAAVWMLVRRSGLTAVSNDALDVMTRGLVTLVHRIGPSLPLYAAATALLATALGLWWWAERDATF